MVRSFISLARDAVRVMFGGWAAKPNDPPDTCAARLISSGPVSSISIPAENFRVYPNAAYGGRVPLILATVNGRPEIERYTDQGFATRDEYLACLAEEYDVDEGEVHRLAAMLGPEEDFHDLPAVIMAGKYHPALRQAFMAGVLASDELRALREYEPRLMEAIHRRGSLGSSAYACYGYSTIAMRDALNDLREGARASET